MFLTHVKEKRTMLSMIQIRAYLNLKKTDKFALYIKLIRQNIESILPNWQVFIYQVKDFILILAKYNYV